MFLVFINMVDNVTMTNGFMFKGPNVPWYIGNGPMFLGPSVPRALGS